MMMMMMTLNELAVTFGGCYLCATWRKSIKKCNCGSADRQIRTRTDRVKLNNLSHAVCYSLAMGQIIIYEQQTIML